jgi:transcriptional/translational regulatory protein YebC/TACO1
MAGAGSVAWQFEKKGLIVVDRAKAGEDKLMEIAVGAGADDLSAEGEKFEITTGPHEFEAVRAALEGAGVPMESGQLTMIPKNLQAVSAEGARSVLNLIEALEEHDDVQNVYANCDIPDEVMKEIS